MSRKLARKTLFAMSAALALAAPAGAAVHSGLANQIGYTQLLNELGAAMPTGAGVTVSHVEPHQGGHYAPDMGNVSHFGNITFTLQSGASGTSGHAHDVAQNFYSHADSIAPGITNVHLWEANDWLASVIRVNMTGLAPLAETAKVQNHSWIGSYGSDFLDADAMRRLDYSINANDTIVVVGTNNGFSTTVPKLLVSAYNTISVGLPNGNHAAGFTSIDAIGRVKPEIVVGTGHESSLTSFATPVVAAAATLLVETGAAMGSANAQHSETIKAVLLAGATKKQFGDWDRTQTRPLDERYGAGNLNLYRSYHILAAGEQEAGDTPVAKTGWDFNTTVTGTTRKYFFDLAQPEEETSIVLTWNRLVDDPGVPGFDTGAFVANLDLRLSTAFGNTVGTLIDQSISTVDNVELIYQQNLPAGSYVIEVASSVAGIDYALAWTSIPEPRGLMAVLVLASMLTRRNRFRTA